MCLCCFFAAQTRQPGQNEHCLTGWFKKKKIDVFLSVPIEVRNYLVCLPALVADGLFVDVLLVANRMKAIIACPDVG